MKHGSTLFLRSVIILIAVSVLAVCTFVLPIGLRSDNTGYYGPIILGLYVAAVPFFLALYQALKLLKFIDNNEAFSSSSVAAFGQIKYCALAISGLFLLGTPYIFYAADQDDAPGVMAVACIIIFASFVIATFSAVLQKLVQTAVDIKTENDLTV